MDKSPDFSAIADTFKNIQTSPKFLSPRSLVPDSRSRSERREDLEKELAALDKPALIKILACIKEIRDYEDGYENALWEQKNDIENSITKLIDYIDKFEAFNADEARKIELKKKELRLESAHDWKEKFRLFFFRVLASLLFISTLFVIGYIEHEYEWARLPLSKYVSTEPPAPQK